MKKSLIYLATTLAALALLTKLSLSFYKTYRASWKVKELEDAVLAEQQKKEELEALLSKRRSLSFVEEEARRQLYMVKEGENLVVIPSRGAQSSLRAYRLNEPEARLKTQNLEEGESNAENRKANYLLWKELLFGP